MGMSMILNKFRSKVNSSKDVRMKSESEQDVAYPTGFLSFDYLNGTVVHVKSGDKKYKYNSVGIIDGSIVMVIGRSGCGKTTFAIQSAGYIVKKFETSCIFHEDIEGGITTTRTEQLLELFGEDLRDKYLSRNSGITAENFFQRIKMIYDLKMEDRSAYEYDTGLYDRDGQRIFKLEPTIVILDSLAMLMPEKYTDEEELSGQMSATAMAKANSSIFKRLIPMLKAANIILFIINHITEAVEINPFSHSQGQLAFLKPGERLGGGRVPIYVSNLIIRMDDHSKQKPAEGYKIKGTLVTVSVVKSRTCSSGNSVNLVFDYENGFDRDLSLFELIKEKGLVNGSGAHLYLGDRSDIKFAKANIKKLLRSNEEFRKVFMDTAYIALEELINSNNSTIIRDVAEDTFNISDSMEDRLKMREIA